MRDCERCSTRCAGCASVCLSHHQFSGASCDDVDMETSKIATWGKAGYAKSAFSDASPTLRFGSKMERRKEELPAGTELHAAAAFFVKDLVRHTLFSFSLSVTSVCSHSLLRRLLAAAQTKRRFRDRSNRTWPRERVHLRN